MASRLLSPLRSVGRAVVDYALPPRCAGCGEVIEEAGAFCTPCWNGMEWLGNEGCGRCGLPLLGTEADTCARCLAQPPKLDRIRAAVAYDELPRAIALNLKYGRKVGLARTMARYMAPLKGAWGDDALLVPVPLHRWRLWNRGFNQSILVARELGRIWHIPKTHHVLRRVKRTQPLKGMSHSQRRKAVSGAFRVADSSELAGKTVVLIDDVLTSGSTAEACAKALQQAGAARVELICWARVVRPSQLMR
jgi:ComF family protein